MKEIAAKKFFAIRQAASKDMLKYGAVMMLVSVPAVSAVFAAF